jgi:hypothetical protein
LEFEAGRSEASRQKRQRQKESGQQRNWQVPPTEAFICPRCNRSCASRIRLFSHQRACRMLFLLNSDHLPKILAIEETVIIFHIQQCEVIMTLSYLQG